MEAQQKILNMKVGATGTAGAAGAAGTAGAAVEPWNVRAVYFFYNTWRLMFFIIFLTPCVSVIH